MRGRDSRSFIKKSENNLKCNTFGNISLPLSYSGNNHHIEFTVENICALNECIKDQYIIIVSGGSERSSLKELICLSLIIFRSRARSAENHYSAAVGPQF